MKTDRWNEVDNILQSVLERVPAERRAYVDEVCSGDEELRREVLTLMGSHEQAGSFMASPALEGSGDVFEDGPTLKQGDSVGRYKITKPIGHGGMGEVYLAEDTTQNREVALKILPRHFLDDPQRVQRFRQEARAVLALNHPNIVTVYDIGEADGVHFISTEFVEGETLRKRMAGPHLTIGEAVEIAAQVGGAIAYAHEKGVIHRDLKPENIMLRPDGYVKVLDFGIAKLTERGASTNEAGTRIKVGTSPGTVMGTPQYMSPEQARGLIVDERSDTWSLGCVLYEMLTGRQAFEGETPSDVLATILKNDSAPLCSLAPEAPPELEQILLKALDKSQDERYQTAKDFQADLRRFKRRYEHESVIERSTPPSRIRRTTATVSTGWQRTSSGAAESALASAVTGHATSSVEYMVDGIRHHKSITFIALVVLGLGIAGIAGYWRAPAAEVAIDSIVVLPFANLNNEDSEYLSDGLTESIINNLTRLPNLRVIARTSAFRYKGKELDPMAVGKELGVRAVLTGRVSQRGDSLTISAELLDVRDNKQLWGEQYQRKISDLLVIEREIAQEITGSLRPKLSAPEQARVAKPNTENAEAYQLYLKGRYFWWRFSPADHQKAAQYFNQAIAKDPTYALAYSGLSDTYGASSTNSWIAPSEGYPKAMAAVKKALELDETLAEAHCTLGALTMFYLLDWATAEREYKRAIELNPNYSTTYEVYSYLLTASGRLTEAIDMAKRGLASDPLSVPLSNDVGQAYYQARQYDEAIKQHQKSNELDPGQNGTYAALGFAYVQKGMYAEALTVYQKGIEISERTPSFLTMMGHAYALSGKRDQALKILSELKQMSEYKYVASYDLAILYTGLGEKDKAFEQLDKAIEERSGWVIYLNVEPFFDPLRSDPRYKVLVKRLNLTPA